MANDPWTGARLGVNTDSPLGGQFFAEAVNELGVWTEPTFATAAARDTALANWVANGNTAKDGMRCRTANDKQSWVYLGGQWSWPSEAQGQLTRASYTDSGNSATNGMTPLAAAPTQLPAFNVTVPFLPAGRHIRVTFSGQIMCTGSAPTAFGFVLGMAGTQHRGVVQIAMASSTSNPIPQEFNISYTFDTTSQTTPATGGINSASLWAGSGTCYLVNKAGDIDAPTQLLVEDLGAV